MGTACDIAWKAGRRFSAASRLLYHLWLHYSQVTQQKTSHFVRKFCSKEEGMCVTQRQTVPLWHPRSTSIQLAVVISTDLNDMSWSNKQCTTDRHVKAIHSIKQRSSWFILLHFNQNRIFLYLLAKITYLFLRFVMVQLLNNTIFLKYETIDEKRGRYTSRTYFVGTAVHLR